MSTVLTGGGTTNLDALAVAGAASIGGALTLGAAAQAVPSGSAPLFGARAWCNFDGTLSGTITPRGSGNIASIVKNATGDYTITFATAMPDANYAIMGLATSDTATSTSQWGFVTSRLVAEHLAGSVRITVSKSFNATTFDSPLVSLMIIR